MAYKSFEDILKQKFDYYGKTMAAICFAAEEYSTNNLSEYLNKNSQSVDIEQIVTDYVKEKEGTAEEYVQEIGDEEKAMWNIALAQGARDILEIIKSKLHEPYH